jgi:uncharacterized membrane protein YphA (DoxX/SURF4 family)
MPTHVIRSARGLRYGFELERLDRLAAYLVPVGRAFFAAIFLMSAFGDFSQRAIDQAARQGVPAATIAVPLAGLIDSADGSSFSSSCP